jgi:predicted CXXCH cytochrome family protein
MKKLAAWKNVLAAFVIVFAVCTIAGGAIARAGSIQTLPLSAPIAQGTGGYGGSASCKGCHKETHETWSSTLHAHAYSSPIFQEDWVKQGSAASCLECHTTGYDVATGTFAEEGVTCEACHGPLQAGHPETPMTVTPDATLCARCHKTTTDEWRASTHGQANINCEACHNPHSQAPRAASVNELCGTCHQETGDSFTHGTHSNAGLQCSDCHMATASHVSSTGGLFATGHTFTVGSEACINCHKDTVHTRDTIARLSGQEVDQAVTTIEDLQKTLQERDQTIQTLEAQGTVRLYTGLIQGAIVGLVTGGVAAWIIGRRIRVVEVGENE